MNNHLCHFDTYYQRRLQSIYIQRPEIGYLVTNVDHIVSLKCGCSLAILFWTSCAMLPVQQTRHIPKCLLQPAAVNESLGCRTHTHADMRVWLMQITWRPPYTNIAEMLDVD